MWIKVNEVKMNSNSRKLVSESSEHMSYYKIKCFNLNYDVREYIVDKLAPLENELSIPVGNQL